MKGSSALMVAIGMLWLGLQAGADSDGGILALGLWGTGGILLAELLFRLFTRGSRRRVPQP
ncbi:hypothetical protein [Aeromicrobium sp. IC_218]|uniref:hypothetical protein n=1 Tax=Aeromicrobium sp. IC_218 TaxID=2545468 RepID=UPI00103A9582|nr:hypothetical protein [Aeromicrobium sp. IC_218]TCI99153.1 hypothetical protein E0W78_08095 [Aeromicrobium sp. IC_218]